MRPLALLTLLLVAALAAAAAHGDGSAMTKLKEEKVEAILDLIKMAKKDDFDAQDVTTGVTAALTLAGASKKPKINENVERHRCAAELADESYETHYRAGAVIEESRVAACGEAFEVLGVVPSYREVSLFSSVFCFESAHTLVTRGKASGNVWVASRGTRDGASLDWLSNFWVHKMPYGAGHGNAQVHSGFYTQAESIMDGKVRYIGPDERARITAAFGEVAVRSRKIFNGEVTKGKCRLPSRSAGGFFSRHSKYVHKRRQASTSQAPTSLADILTQHTNKDKRCDVHFVGHSMGGAVAQLLGLTWSIKQSCPAHKKVSVTTIAAPRVGNKDYATLALQHTNTEMIVRAQDPAPYVPLRNHGYTHASTKVFYFDASLLRHKYKEAPSVGRAQEALFMPGSSDGLKVAAYLCDKGAYGELLKRLFKSLSGRMMTNYAVLQILLSIPEFAAYHRMDGYRYLLANDGNLAKDTV